MAKKTKALCKLCRREGEKLFLKAEKCFTAKCPLERRSYAPGQHGRLPVRLSEYGIRLREKQKAKRMYGLTERQFVRYFEMAARKKGITGEKLLELLERRLDNVVFKLGFASSRLSARRIINHGHIKVNGRKVNIPSYQVRVDDLITPNKERSIKLLKDNLEKNKDRLPPAWLLLDRDKLEGKVLRLPTTGDITTPLSMQLIVEYYSR